MRLRRNEVAHFQGCGVVGDGGTEPRRGGCNGPRPGSAREARRRGPQLPRGRVCGRARRGGVLWHRCLLPARTGGRVCCSVHASVSTLVGGGFEPRARQRSGSHEVGAGTERIRISTAASLHPGPSPAPGPRGLHTGGGIPPRGRGFPAEAVVRGVRRGRGPGPRPAAQARPCEAGGGDGGGPAGGAHDAGSVGRGGRAAKGRGAPRAGVCAAPRPGPRLQARVAVPAPQAAPLH